MAKSTPEKDALGPGFHVVAPSETAAMVFIHVLQRAAELYAQELASRTDLDQPYRLGLYDEFIKDLVTEAKNSILDRVDERQETQAKIFVCQMIGTVALAPRRMILGGD